MPPQTPLPSSLEIAQDKSTSRQSTVMLFCVGLIGLLATSLFVKNIWPLVELSQYTPDSLEAKLLKLCNEGQQDDAHRLASKIFNDVPYLVEASQHFAATNAESLDTFLAKRKYVMRPFQASVLRAALFLRRYDTAKVFKGHFAAIAHIDLESQTGKVSKMLSLVEETKNDDGSQSEQTDALFDRLREATAESADCALLTYAAGVICNSHGRSREAINYFEQLSKKWDIGPKFFRNDFADLLYDEEFYYDAYKFREKTLTLNPTAAAYSEFAESCSNMNLPKKAVEASAKATELEPNVANHWIMRAKALQYDGDFEKAVISAKRAVSIDPKAPNGWYWWGQALASLDKPEEAFQVWKDGADENPDNKHLKLQVENYKAYAPGHTKRQPEGQLLGQAKLLTHQKNYELRFIQQHATGQLSNIRKEIEKIYLQLDGFSRASLYRKFRKSPAYSGFLSANKAQLLAESEIAFLYAIICRSVDDKELSAFLLATVGHLTPNSQLGLLASTISDLEYSQLEPGSLTESDIQRKLNVLIDLVDEDRTSPLALWLSAMACRSLDEEKKGIEFFDRLQEYWSPGPPVMHQTHANLLNEANRYNEALKKRYQGLTIQETHLGYVQLGHTYENLNRFDEALLAYDKAQKLRPNSPTVIRSMAYTYMRTGEHHKAISHYKHALKLDAKSEYSWSNYASCLRSIDRPQDSYRVLMLGKKYCPDSRLIETHLKQLERQKPDSYLPLSLKEALSDEF